MSKINLEKELFEAALECSTPEARAALLAKACDGDPERLERIHALLRASEAPAAFLPEAPRDPLGGGPGACESAWVGAVVGRYKLLERIGEGGFGVVYMAEQLEPIRRRVALKVIKPGMDSKQVIGRFEAERQALALMDHPNIAQIFDAGTTGVNAVAASAGPALPQAGRPYFVMELVRGVPLTQFCDDRCLDMEARVRLFLEVCDAVQHAHQKGVIHRDLKPSNILVTLHGERPVPKVIDFGIAKATSLALTDKTLFTQFQHFLGTPAYMSPEQAALSGLDVDTRSDIYSLGVLLYELLTGGPPFDSKQLLSSGLDGLRRTICEREPDPPSKRLSRLRRGSSSMAGQPTAADPGAGIPRDLDLVVLKALEKDRERRYATANGFAADLLRFLNHEPVTAVAPTPGYHLAKLIRRHRTVAVASLCFAVLLLAAALFGTVLAIRAQRAEALARTQAGTALNVNEFLWKELLKRLTSYSHTNPGISLHEAFTLAAANIPQRLKDQPLAEASIRFTFGKAHAGLGELEAAATNLLRALDLRRAHLPSPDEPTADILFQLGMLSQQRTQWVEGTRWFAEAASLRAQLLGPEHRDTVAAATKAEACRARALPPREAEALLTQALARISQTIGPEHYVARGIRNQLGSLLHEQDRLDEALAHFSESYRLAVSEEGQFSGGAIWALELMLAVRTRQGDFLHAAALWQKLATAVRSSQPQRREAVAQSIEAFLVSWKANGGGAEVETFRRQMAGEPALKASPP